MEPILCFSCNLSSIDERCYFILELAFTVDKLLLPIMLLSMCVLKVDLDLDPIVLYWSKGPLTIFLILILGNYTPTFKFAIEDKTCS